MNKTVYTVGEINKYIKNMFSQDFLLNKVFVRAEVSNCKYHSAGHIYFTLKDETGVLKAVMFKSSRQRGLPFSMKTGDKVVVCGSVRVYEKTGEYQLYAEKIILDGAGDLNRKFEELKARLLESGMFDPMYKKSIPKYAGRIGIVTAKTGAAIRDIQNISARRNPYVQLILYPALVQGEGAAQTIVQGIRALEKEQVDVIIVGRGGGSMEDLWAFNEEIVARAIFDCSVPVISAVGHETDTTISDFVADMRAPTPSAAAELAVFDINEVLREISSYKFYLSRELSGKIGALRSRAGQLALRLDAKSPKSVLIENRRRCADVIDRLERICSERLAASKDYAESLAGRADRRMELLYTDRRHRLELISSRLEGNSPLARLRGGFGYIKDRDGKALLSVSCVKGGDNITAVLSDGQISAVVSEVEKNG